MHLKFTVIRKHLSAVAAAAFGFVLLIWGRVEQAAAAQTAGKPALQRAQDQLKTFGERAGVQTKSLTEVVAQLIRGALSLLGIILVALIIYGGYLWMTAQGEEDKIKKAKDLIKNAVIGLIITFSAYAIANFVFGQIIQTTAR